MAAWVGVAHVLGGADHDAPRDELRVLAGIDHAREPVERGVGVAPAHGLDERGDDVVVHVAVLVVGEPMTGVRLLHELAGDDGPRVGRIDVRAAARIRGRIARGSIDRSPFWLACQLGRQLERGQRRAGIALGEPHDGI